MTFFFVLFLFSVIFFLLTGRGSSSLESVEEKSKVNMDLFGGGGGGMSSFAGLVDAISSSANDSSSIRFLVFIDDFLMIFDIFIFYF